MILTFLIECNYQYGGHILITATSTSSDYVNLLACFHIKFTDGSSMVCTVQSNGDTAISGLGYSSWAPRLPSRSFSQVLFEYSSHSVSIGTQFPQS